MALYKFRIIIIIIIIEEPKKIVTSKGTAKSRIWGAEIPKPVATKFCMPGAVQEIITYATFWRGEGSNFGLFH